MSARDEILSRIRTALGPRAGTPSVRRDYAGATGEPGDLGLFADRLAEYRARVRRVRRSGDVAAAVAATAAERGVRRLVVPPGIPGDWLTRLTDVEVWRDEPPLPLRRLDGADGVLTACRVAIAETGTIVLDGDADQGRRALTLIPDLHLCVVRADQVVPDVPDALAQTDPRRPLTFISGPSATSDIELQRIEGVHGPRTLVAVLVGEAM